MAQKVIQNEMATLSLRHRAICEDDRYRGRWRKEIEQAYQDAENHKKKPGNENHIMRIISEQRISMIYK